MSSWFSFGGSAEEKQADEAKAWKESYLGTGDENFTHSRSAKPDIGHFKVTDVRERPKQADRGGSMLVRLPPGNYQDPPQIAKGLKSCDLNYKAKDHFQKQSMDLALEVFADDNKILSPVIQAWLSDENTQLIYDAEMVWMEAKHNAEDCMILNTTFDLSKGEHEKSIKFPRAHKGVEFEVVGWMQGFRFSTEGDDPYSIDFWPSKVTTKGFTANAKGSPNCERVGTTWIVYRNDKKKVETGTFSLEDGKGWKGNGPESTGHVKFENDNFTKAPTVIAALSQFEHAGKRDLRIGVEVSKVTKDGFDWKLHTWGPNSKGSLQSAEATFVALAYV